MGHLISGACSWHVRRAEIKLFLAGFDSAGKTTILYKLKLHEVVTTIPTIGSNLEKIEYKGIDFTILDGIINERWRHIWVHFFGNNNGLVFVVDSADRERIDMVKECFCSLLKTNELRGVPVLIYANKQDIPNAMSPDELCKRFDLASVEGRPWKIQGSSAVTGDGIYEGLDWFAEQMNLRS